MEILLSLVESVAPKAMLEFGVNEGLTAKTVLDHVRSIETYQGIDVLPGYVTGCKVQRREIPKKPGHLVEDVRFELLLRPRGSLDFAPSDLKPCDVAFIDGDHSAAVVKHDTRLADLLVRPGGIVIWHDYHDQGTVDVRDVLDAMHANGRRLQHVQGTWLVYEQK